MELVKTCLIKFTCEHTNEITDKEIDDDTIRRFSLLDMQKFAKKYAEEYLKSINHPLYEQQHVFKVIDLLTKVVSANSGNSGSIIAKDQANEKIVELMKQL